MAADGPIMAEEDEKHQRRKHIPEGIEYKHRADAKEKRESRVGVHGAAEGSPEPGGEGGPPV